MLDAPIGGGANIFLWIVCILVGFITALSIIDQLKNNKSEDKKSDH